MDFVIGKTPEELREKVLALGSRVTILSIVSHAGRLVAFYVPQKTKNSKESNQ